MESKTKCEVCGKSLKLFSVKPDWESRKLHKKCYKKMREHERLKEEIDRINETYGMNIEFPKFPKLNIAK